MANWVHLHELILLVLPKELNRNLASMQTQNRVLPLRDLFSLLIMRRQMCTEQILLLQREHSWRCRSSINQLCGFLDGESVFVGEEGGEGWCQVLDYDGVVLGVCD